jgi:cysteate synthase
LFDALTDSGGKVLTATNTEAAKAAALFLETEGIDIHPAAAIATATLIKQVQQKKLPADALIMLNITGGGEERFKKDKKLYFLEPSLVFDLGFTAEEVCRKTDALFGF